MSPTPFMIVPPVLDFRNESLSDFTQVGVQQKMSAALKSVRAQMGNFFPLIINGQAQKNRRTFTSVDPSHFSDVVGVVANADLRQAELALNAAVDCFPSWSATAPEKRAGILRRMASLLRERKFEFCAWMIYEVGKNWAEADADVAEAIDF